MPLPVAERVPNIFKDEIAALNLSGLSAYAEAKGLLPSTLHSLCSNSHKQVQPHLVLTRVIRQRLDANFTVKNLVEIIRAGEASKLLDRLKKAENCDTWVDLAAKVGVSTSFLKRMALDTKELKALNPCVSAAEKTGVDLNRLFLELGLQ